MTRFAFFCRLICISIISAILLSACTSSPYLTLSEAKKNQSVKLYLSDGQIYEGILTELSEDKVTIVTESEHQPFDIDAKDIRRIERSEKKYDYLAHPISDAEIEKYRENRNAWGYTLGGAAIGGLSGLAIGVPVWLAADDPPPFFVSGVGAVVGSIYFATRGITKDKEDAISKVRFLRARERQLELEKKAEEQRLEELEKRKQELLKKLAEKKKQEKDNGKEN